MKLAHAMRLTKLRLIIAAALAAATVLALSSHALAQPAGPRTSGGNGGTKPVIVLVHGAWADASSWDGGHPALAG